MIYLVIARDVRYEAIVEAPADGSVPPVELSDMQIVNDSGMQVFKLKEKSAA